MGETTRNQTETGRDQYDSMVAYLYEDGGSYLLERAEEISGVIKEALMIDGEGNITGIADDSFFSSNNIRHLRFVRDSGSKHLIELDEIELPDGTLMADLLENHALVRGALKNQSTSEEAVITKRAVIMLAAADILVDSYHNMQSAQQTTNCA